MKKGWDIKPLQDFCDFGNGLWTGKKPPYIEVGVIRNTNFTKDGELDDSDIVYLNVEQSQFIKRKLQFGDIILEKSGGGPKQPVGRVVIFDKEDGDFSFSNFTSVIRIRDSRQVFYKFLHRYLYHQYINGVTEKMQSHSTGIRNLKFDDYKQITVPILPLPEQQRIVSILDESFASIAKVKDNAEKNLANAWEVFESYSQSVFNTRGKGFEEKTLGEVCSLITDGKHGDCENESNSGYYFLSAKDVRNDTLLYENARQITKIDFTETHRRTNLTPGDICMVNTGATIGRISIAPDDDRTLKTTFQKSVAVIKTIPSLINNYYCCYLLKSDMKKLVKVSSGTAVHNLLLGDLKKHKISIPKSLVEQKSIVSKLDSLSAETKKLENIYKKKLADLEELKKSILEKAFNGELNTN